MFDVLIIGCGVVGAALSYYLSKYELNVCVCERYNDVANGCTKANTAILHAGFDCPVGSLEAKLNLRGIKEAREICKKLDVEMMDLPTFIVAFNNKHELDYIDELYHRGVENGVEGIKILNREEALNLEPALNPEIERVLYAPGSGIINPWEYCIAMAETAVRNGTTIKLNSEVTAIKKDQEGFEVVTTGGSYRASYIVNAAGGWAAAVYGLVGGSGFEQTNFAGQYYVLDKKQGELLHSVVFPCPDEHGFKGVCVTPTVHGNLLVGPDCYHVEDGDQVRTDKDTLEALKEEGRKTVPGIDYREIIHEYAGIRPNTQVPDFTIEEAKDCANFINLIGIKSPGLSSAPAIAEEAIQVLRKCGLELSEKATFTDERKCVRFRKLNDEQKKKMIEQNPLYGRVICRCETITEAEIVEAINRPIVPRTIDAIKRRCNAGMGRCQGGFCGPRVHEILARELGESWEHILMDEEGTYIITSSIKE